MKTKRSVLSALLAGAMVFSLAGCTGAASIPGAAAATAAPTAEGVPQGRWVESTVGIPQGLSLCGAVALREDGTLLAFAENDDGRNNTLVGSHARSERTSVRRCVCYPHRHDDSADPQGMETTGRRIPPPFRPTLLRGASIPIPCRPISRIFSVRSSPPSGREWRTRMLPSPSPEDSTPDSWRPWPRITPGQ